MRIVLAAEEAAGIRMLRALATREIEIVAVLAQETRTEAAGRSVWDVARNMELPTWPAEDVTTPALAERIAAADVDAALNVHSLYVVDPAVLAAPRHGWFNLHPGLLPRYAGLNTVSWAIYEGATAQGVTIHRMDPGIDTGPVAFQETFPIEEHDTGLSLSSRCVEVGVRLMLDLADTLARDPRAVPAIAQDPGALHYYRRHDIPEGGRFGWDEPARRVVDTIRAFDYHPLPSPWGYPRMVLGGVEVGIIGARRTGRPATKPPGTIAADDGGHVLVACRDEWVRVRRIHVDGSIRDAATVLGATVAGSGGGT